MGNESLNKATPGAETLRARLSKRQSPDPEPAVLPTIASADVTALRDAGKLAAVEVYPLPDLRAPGAPPTRAMTVAASTPTPTSIADVRPEASASVPSVPALRAPAVAGAIARSGTAALALRLDDGRTVELDGNLIIGRTPAPKVGEEAVAIEDPRRTLSRSHLRVELDELGRAFVVDLESANGTELLASGGFRTACLPGRRYRINAGDVVLIGEFELDVEPASG